MLERWAEGPLSAGEGERGEVVARGDRTASVAFALVVILAVAYAFTFAAIALRNFDALAAGYDMANYDQALWNTVHGQPLRFTTFVGVTSRLGVHVEPILLPLSLLYLLWSDPRSLLALQAIAVAAGALPVYWLARHELRLLLAPRPKGSHPPAREKREWERIEGGRGAPNTGVGNIAASWAALVPALAYLLFPGLQAAVSTAFHAVTLSPTFLLLAYYSLLRRRDRLFVAFAALAMATKEDIPLEVVALGLYALIFQRRLRLGLLTVALGLGWFFTDVSIIIPNFNPGGQSPYLGNYGYLGQDPLAIAWGLLTHPAILWERLVSPPVPQYLLSLLVPFGFLPLLSPAVLITLPSLAINVLSTSAPMHVPNHGHYAAPLAPFLAIAAVQGGCRLAAGVTRVMRGHARVAVFLVSLMVLGSSLSYYRVTVLGGRLSDLPPREVTDHDLVAHRLARLVPAEASVATQLTLLPLVSQRRDLYALPRVENADYVFYDVTVYQSDLEADDIWDLTQKLLAGEYGLVAAEDGYLLLAKGAPKPSRLPDSFYSFALGIPGKERWSTSVTFGDLLEFLGLDLTPGSLSDRAQGEVELTLYWRALRPIERSYTLAAFFADEEGHIFTSRAHPAINYWYATTEWVPGQEVETLVKPPVPLDRGKKITVYVGVLEGEDEWAVEKRLEPHARQADAAGLILPGQRLAATVVIEARRGFFRRATPAGEPRALAQPAPPERPLPALLGDKVRLLGYDLQQSDRGHWRVTLHWQALAEMDVDYTVFVHLYDQQGRLVAQQDGQPHGGRHPTSAWRKGEYVLDEHEVVVDTAIEPGSYRLATGLYDSATGRRLEAPPTELGSGLVILSEIDLD